ncbi:MAG: DUF4097 family beta strand repeat-containing protein [Verrucomicrobiota bacterium]
MKIIPLITMKQIALFLLLISSAAFAATEDQTNKTFKATPGGHLVVNVDFGSIEVTTNAGNEIAVDVWRKITRKNTQEEQEFLRDNPVKLLQAGDALTIQCQRKEKNRWSFGGRNLNEAKYTIRVPAQFNAALNTAGGGIAVSDLSGEVKADTSGGGLRFTRVRGPLNGNTSGGSIGVADCEGKIRIQTSGGGIDINGGSGSVEGETAGGSITVKTFSGPATVETSGGGITIEKVAGKIKGSTSGGSINAVLVSPLPGDVTLSTAGGGITVRVPTDAALNLDAETSGGGVSSDLPVTMEGKKERSRLKGTINGGGPVVHLRSSGGGIGVKKI